MEAWLHALVFGLLSASSLPLGAVIGICVAPIAQWVTACFMAFGAGALVYAVSTELFGEALFFLHFSGDSRSPEGGCSSVCMWRFWDLCVQNCSAIAGAVLYILLNRWLNPKSSAAGGGHPRRIQSGSLSRSTSRSISRSTSRSISRSFVDEGYNADCPDEAEEDDDGRDGDDGGHGSASVAFSMWLGLVLDGIPESLMIGFMTVEEKLGLELLVSIFIANFPEAFSGAAILRQAGMPVWKIMGMWLFVLVLTGAVSMIGAALLPADVVVGSSAARVQSTSSAAAQGLTGGSMLAMISTAMLPEAFHGIGSQAGLFFVLGFVASVSVSVISVRLGGPEAFMPGHS